MSNKLFVCLFVSLMLVFSMSLIAQASNGEAYSAEQSVFCEQENAQRTQESLVSFAFGIVNQIRSTMDNCGIGLEDDEVLSLPNMGYSWTVAMEFGMDDGSVRTSEVTVEAKFSDESFVPRNIQGPLFVQEVVDWWDGRPLPVLLNVTVTANGTRWQGRLDLVSYFRVPPFQHRYTLTYQGWVFRIA